MPHAVKYKKEIAEHGKDFKKINLELNEKLRKTSVPLDSEGMKKLSPELISKVSGSQIADISDDEGRCCYCGGQVYVWQSDKFADQSYDIFCGTCGAVFESFGDFNINNAN